ncbi:16072_t:CDS:1, partial [Acaulospora colombiana]
MYELEQSSYPFTLDESTMVNGKVKYMNEIFRAFGNEKFEPEDTLEVIASASTYLNISFKRYVDIISMTVIHDFVERFSNQIEEKLIELYISNGDNCDVEELVRENHDISNLREELRIKEKHMKEILDSLVRFGVV